MRHSWARLWDEGRGYACNIDLTGTPPPAPLSVLALRRAAATFSLGTGLGADNRAPRAFCKLSDVVLEAMVQLLMAMELFGEWAHVFRLVLITLLP